MALPTCSRLWNKRFNVQVPASSSIEESQRRWAWEWKNSMLLVGGGNVTLSGSSDAVTSGMDGVDRWADYTKVIRGNPRSWVVLRFPQISPKFEICWDMTYNYGGDVKTSCMYVSPSAGYGTANGGSDGSISSKPTALDEVGIVRLTPGMVDCSFLSQIEDWNSYNAGRCHFWGDQSGRWFYWARLYNSSVMVFGFLGVPNNPVSEWANNPKWVMGIWGSSSGAARRANFTANGRVFTQINGIPSGSTPQALGAYLTGEMVNGSFVSAYQTFPADLNAGYPMTPIGIYSTAPFVRGRMGNLPDAWWGAESNVLVGDTFPGDGSNQFIQLDHIVLPWDGSIPFVTG